MKLKEGMHVRTEKGDISKIERFIHSCYLGKDMKSATIHLENDETIRMYYGDEIKASFNIIDLIEVGDYVNGYLVEDVGNTFLNIATGSNYFQKPTIFENDIKSIVTKEQFESMEYNVLTKEKKDDNM